MLVRLTKCVCVWREREGERERERERLINQFSSSSMQLPPCSGQSQEGTSSTPRARKKWSEKCDLKNPYFCDITFFRNRLAVSFQPIWAHVTERVQTSILFCKLTSWSQESDTVAILGKTSRTLCDIKVGFLSLVLWPFSKMVIFQIRWPNYLSRVVWTRDPLWFREQPRPQGPPRWPTSHAEGPGDEVDSWRTIDAQRFLIKVIQQNCLQ